MSLSKPRFSVLIVNFNSGQYLAGAVDSLRRQTFRDFEVIVVDNASSDGSQKPLGEEGLPTLVWKAETENHGFAKGNNLAAYEAQGEWLVLLNPDAVAMPDWLEQIDAATRRHPSAAMFATCQHALEAPGTLDGVGDAYLAFGFPWRGGYGRPISECPDEGECFSPCGAGAVIERATFLAHGGFDERYFCFCEDVDLGFRLQLAGERCVFIPDARIDHAGGAISGTASDFTLYHGFRNRIWVYGKNMPWQLVCLTLPGSVALHVYLLLRAAMTGKFGIVWKGVRDGLLRLGEIRQDAKWRTRVRHRSILSLIRIMAWNPMKMREHSPHVRNLETGSTQ